MAEFHAEASDRCEGIDDEATAVTGMVIPSAGVGLLLDGALDADRAREPLVCPPGIGLASLRPRGRITERTTGERLLDHSAPLPASGAAIHP